MEEVDREFCRWNHLAGGGCQDPGWPDGVNMNLVRNHIIYWYGILEERGFAEIQLSLFPGESVAQDRRPVPPGGAGSVHSAGREIPAQAVKKDVARSGLGAERRVPCLNIRISRRETRRFGSQTAMEQPTSGGWMATHRRMTFSTFGAWRTTRSGTADFVSTRHVCWESRSSTITARRRPRRRGCIRTLPEFERLEGSEWS